MGLVMPVHPCLLTARVQSSPLRPFLLKTLTMIAFAANSVLNRFGMGDKLIDPQSFAMIRLLAGALMLAGLRCCGAARCGLDQRAG